MNPQWIGILITAVTVGFNAAMFVVIKFNDMKHLEETLRRLESKFDCLEKKNIDALQRISTIEGTCKANHG